MKKSGASLVELLVVMALMGVFGAIMVTLTGGAARDHRLQAALTESQQNVSVLAQVLQNDLRLAGYNEFAAMGESWSKLGVTSLEGDNQKILVRYRQLDAAGLPQTFTRTYGPDNQGNVLTWNDGSGPEVITDEVEAFRVFYLDKAGAWSTARPAVGQFSALGVYIRVRSPSPVSSSHCGPWPTANAGLPASAASLGVSTVTYAGAVCNHLRQERTLVIYPASNQWW